MSITSILQKRSDCPLWASAPPSFSTPKHVLALDKHYGPHTANQRVYAKQCRQGIY